MQPRARTTTQRAIFRVGCFYFLFSPFRLPLRLDGKRRPRGLDGPGGFTSAESDDVKADGCKSWQRVEDKERQTDERDGRYTTRGGESGTSRKGTQGRRGGHARTHVREERVETGGEGRICGGSIIPVYIHSPHIHSGAKLLS